MQTPGTSIGHVVPTTGRALLEGQQAAGTLHLINFETGQLFDWFISQNKAFPLCERLFGPGAGLNKGFTQIPGNPNTNDGVSEPFIAGSSQDFSISPGFHNYALRYSRNQHGSGTDRVEYLIDGKVLAHVENVGVPLDVQNRYYRDNTITYPSVGPGEALRDKMNVFSIATGLFSLVDEWPFNQFPYNFVSIPTAERNFGQGAISTFDNVTVTTQTLP